jgi:hypothetical protein
MESGFTVYDWIEANNLNALNKLQSPLSFASRCDFLVAELLGSTPAVGTTSARPPARAAVK